MSSPSPFNPKLVIGLIVVGIGAFAALLLLLAFGQNIGAARQGRANAVSVSAVGYKGLVELVGRFHRTSLVRDPQGLYTENLLVVAIEESTPANEVRRILEQRPAQATLIILPKWTVMPFSGRRGWVRGVYSGLGGNVVDRIGDGLRVQSIDLPAPARGDGPLRAEGEDILTGLTLPVPRPLQVIDGAGVRPLVQASGIRRGDAEAVRVPAAQLRAAGARGAKPDGAGGDSEERPSTSLGTNEGGGADKPGADAPSPLITPVDDPDDYPVASPSPGGKPSGNATAGPDWRGNGLVVQLGDAPHYVLADPDLVNNHGLRDPRTAQAALALIEALSPTDASGVDFDLTVNGLGNNANPGLLRMAFEPPFLALTLALFAAAVLAGLHGAFRFGPVRRPARAIAFGKAALVENSAGLIRLAEREGNFGAAYADVVRHETARAVNAPPGLSPERIDAWLDRIGPRDGAKFSELMARLANVRDRQGLMAASRAVIEWKRGVVK